MKSLLPIKCILHRVHELELQRPGQNLLQRVRRDEAGGHGLGGIELGGGAELFDADVGDGRLFTGDEGPILSSPFLPASPPPNTALEASKLSRSIALTVSLGPA